MRLPGARSWYFLLPATRPGRPSAYRKAQPGIARSDAPNGESRASRMYGDTAGPEQSERRQRAALCFEDGVEATTAVNFRITPSALLKT
jgi:hypothetical protein